MVRVRGYAAVSRSRTPHFSCNSTRLRWLPARGAPDGVRLPCGEDYIRCQKTARRLTRLVNTISSRFSSKRHDPCAFTAAGGSRCKHRLTAARVRRSGAPRRMYWSTTPLRVRQTLRSIAVCASPAGVQLQASSRSASMCRRRMSRVKARSENPNRVSSEMASS